MSDNIKNTGFTIVELVIALTVGMTLTILVTSFTFSLFKDTVQAQTETHMLMDSQILLSRVAEDIRFSSSILETNNIDDSYQPGGWNTDNENHILILSTPAQDSSRNFVVDEDTGNPYQNEIVLYSDGNNLYKRVLANPDVVDNRTTTTCPTGESGCRNDPLLTTQFDDMNFIFYDQDGAVIDQAAGNISEARSIEIVVLMVDRKLGETIELDNQVRMTLRNPFFN